MEERRFCGFSNSGVEDGTSCQISLSPRPKVLTGHMGQMGRLKADREAKRLERSERAAETQDQTMQGSMGIQQALALPEPAERGTQVHWV